MPSEEIKPAATSGSAINRLLAESPPGVPMTSDWLTEQGVTPQMLWGYKQRGWLEPMGRGVWKRPRQKIDWTAAVFALQRQQPTRLWPAGRTALSLLGQAHYVPLGGDLPIQLCVTKGYRLPDWLKGMPFGRNLIKISGRQLFDSVYAGLAEWQGPAFTLRVSTPERAMLELCHMTPKSAEPDEVKQLMNGLPALRPTLLQSLLLACRSVKAKRLFLVLAEIVGHPWLEELELASVDLGTGKRSLRIDGHFDPRYQITVPAAWREDEDRVADQG